MKKAFTQAAGSPGGTAADGNGLFLRRGALPMEAVPARPFDSPDCLYELHLDGLRCLAYLGGGTTDLRDRLGRSVGGIFPELYSIHTGAEGECILDGEIIFLTEGIPDPAKLRRRIFSPGSREGREPAHFVAFDLLYQHGRELTELPLARRRERLAGAVAESSALSVLQYTETGGLVFYSLALQRGYGGVVAKRKDSLYRCGRQSPEWSLFEAFHRSRYAVCGCVADDGREIRSLALGAYRAGRPVARGYVSQGISPETASAVLRRAEAFPCACPFGPDGERPGVQWFSPALVCEVEYREQTAQGTYRSPVLLGLCPDRRPEECAIH